jgi:hypothetical protein
MSKSLILSALLCGSAFLYTSAPEAAADPTPDQVYQAARSGHVAQAEQMINQVLQDKPKSGQAHYVAAEVYARAGDISRARAELATAEQLEPGLPFANQNSVSALQRELSSNRVQQAPVWTPVQHERSGLPWGAILLVVIGIGLVWMLVRRRVQAGSYGGSYPANMPPGPGQPGYGTPGMGGPYYPGGGGGSGLMGSLGTGLAIGAGAAVGEELVHHVLEGNHSSGGIIGGASAGEVDNQPQNSNMGGQDFGLNDSNSWGDSSGGDSGSFDSGGGGGDDWT